ncbi:MAG: NADH-quinone oxidoreductase subunit NuoG [Herbaspirillum sp.]
MVEIEIDGKKVEVQEGSMVIEAANKLGTYIPHFCYHKKLSIAANCRMCLVEVAKVPKPLPACATPVSAGMIVKTNSEMAITAQKGVMEFLLINHPLDCPVCDQGGECQLQDLSVGYGASASRYTEQKRAVPAKDGGPLVSMKDMTRCIHCTRCVRFGQEIGGIMELGMLGRGEHQQITAFVGKAIDSELSGNMIDVCPVGALTSRPFRFSARNWELSRRKSVSPHDSLGANLIVQVKGAKVMRVLPLDNEEVNECWLADRDRFSYEGLNSPERLQKPMLKQGGEWCEVDWQVALEYVAQGLRSIRDEHGADSIAALATPTSTLEELSLLQKLICGLGSENVDFRLRQSDFALDGKLVPWLGMSIASFNQLDRAFVIGSFLRKDHPLLASRLRQAVKRGAQVSVLHAVDDDLLMPVANKMIVAPSAWLSALGEIIVSVAKEKNIAVPAGFEAVQSTEISQKIAQSLLGGESRAILLGNAVAQHPQSSLLHASAEWLAQQTGAAFGYLVEGGNAVGGSLAGALPAAGHDASNMFAVPRRAYLLFNTEPELDVYDPQAARAALDQADMVVVLSAYKQTADYGDVLLPISPFTETAGTLVNCEGRPQSFNGAVKPLGETRPGWKVLRVLGNLLGLAGFDYETSEAVRADVLGADPIDLAAVMAKLNNFVGIAPQVDVPTSSALERIADVPIYFSDSMVRHAVSLQETKDARVPMAWISSVLAQKLVVSNGDVVRVTGADTIELVAEIDPSLPDDVVRVAAAHASTAELGPMFGPLSVEKA